MKPEIYKWLETLCSSYNKETKEYDMTLTNSQFLYIVLSYFFLMDEEDVHASDLMGKVGLDGVVSALQTKVKLVTISDDVKYLFIENPKNSYTKDEKLNYRFTFVKLIKGKREWDTSTFGTCYRIIPRLWMLEDGYESEEELISLLKNMDLANSWHCSFGIPTVADTAIPLAQHIHEYFSGFEGSGRIYERGIATGDFRNNYVESFQNISHIGVILNHFAYYLKEENITLGEEAEFDLGNGIDLKK